MDFRGIDPAEEFQAKPNASVTCRRAKCPDGQPELDSHPRMKHRSCKASIFVTRTVVKATPAQRMKQVSACNSILLDPAKCCNALSIDCCSKRVVETRWHDG